MTGPPSPASPITAVGMSATFRVMRKPSRSSSLMCSATERCSAYCSSGMPQMRSLNASKASFLASTRRQIGSLLSMVSSCVCGHVARHDAMIGTASLPLEQMSSTTAGRARPKWELGTTYTAWAAAGHFQTDCRLRRGRRFDSRRNTRWAALLASYRDLNRAKFPRGSSRAPALVMLGLHAAVTNQYTRYRRVQLERLAAVPA